MKKLFTLIAVLASLACVAQNITIKTKDGKEISTSVSGISNSELYTKAGTFKMTTLSTVIFESKAQKDQTVYDRLEAAGVAIAFTNAPILIPGDQQPTDKTLTIEQLADGLEKFRQQRTTGKTLMIVGSLATIAGSVMYADNKDVGGALMAGGAAASLIGIGIDLGAGTHLKFKLK